MAHGVFEVKYRGFINMILFLHLSYTHTIYVACNANAKPQ